MALTVDFQVGIAFVVGLAAGWILRAWRSDARSLPSAPPRPPPASPPEVETEVRRLLQAKQKIQAIKVYRGYHGTSLAEAKDAVEAIERKMSAPS